MRVYNGGGEEAPRRLGLWSGIPGPGLGDEGMRRGKRERSTLKEGLRQKLLERASEAQGPKCPSACAAQGRSGDRGDSTEK